jgi:hypothetical protein
MILPREEMSVGRRELLLGLVATGATALAAGRALAGAPFRGRRRRIEPEPLQHFPGLGEGFHRLGRDIHYIDERGMAWAPAGSARHRFVPIEPLAAAALPPLLRDLRKRHWAWAVEHAVLRRLASEPALAAALLTAALEIDRARPAPSSRRLHALQAALAGTRRRAVWRTVGTDGRAFATRLGAA